MIRDANIQAVCNFLLNASTAQGLLPGAKLPTERALAEQLGVSRNVVRNALAVLEAEGRVLRKVGSGTYIVKLDEPGAWRQGGASKDGLNAAPPMPHVAPLEANPGQIVEARFTLEPHIAGLAAMNGTKTDFAHLADCARRYHRADSFEEYELADQHFHTAIAMATRNPLLIGAYACFSAAHAAAEWGGLRQRFLTAERRTASRQEHDMILEAIRSRDSAAAAAAVLAHLRKIASDILQQ